MANLHFKSTPGLCNKDIVVAIVPSMSDTLRWRLKACNTSARDSVTASALDRIAALAVVIPKTECHLPLSTWSRIGAHYVFIDIYAWSWSQTVAAESNKSDTAIVSVRCAAVPLSWA